MEENLLHHQLCLRVLWSDAELDLRHRIRPLWETSVSDVLKERLSKHVDICKESEKSQTLTLDPLLMIADEMNGIVDKQVLDRVCDCALLGDETQLLAQALAALPHRRRLSTNLLKLLVLALRFNNCNITKMDRGLVELSRLQVLSLAGNWLTRLKGSWLPRSLKFLELYANRIVDVTELVHKMPKFLIHLGLACNKLTKASNLHLLGERCMSLRSLDLGDNDIYDPDVVTDALKDLRHLRSLRLEGNPCATLCDYRQRVLGGLDSIWYLDDMEVWPTDRVVMKSEDEEEPKPSLLLYCYRILGVPEPPPFKVKKQDVEQTYQMEFEVPLLNPTLRVSYWDCNDSRTQLLEHPPPPEPSSEKVTKTKLAKEPSKDDTIDINLSSWVSTEPIHWATIMKFPNPVELLAPECDLRVLRDTLRTKIRAKLVFLQSLKSEKKAKDKKKKGDKEEEKPKVISKDIVAQFLIPLRPVKWCHPTDDYLWEASESGQHPAEAQPVGPTLQNLILPEEIKAEQMRLGSKKDKKGGKNKKDKKNDDKKGKEKKGKKNKKSGTNVTVVDEPPKPLTFHLGVGLRRLKPVPLSIPISDALELLDIRPEKMMALSCTS